LREKYSDPNAEVISQEKVQQLRMAALLHDCSHGPFSHTSEDIYSAFEEMQECIRPLKPFEGSSASEVLAHFILTSEPFKTFLEKIKENITLNLEPSWLSDIILGKRPDLLNAHYTDIINGPFDADKLDYIFRDGHYSGLPLGVDLDRLWFATEVHVIRPEDLRGVQSPMRRLVMARAGINSLEQIVSARMNLTSSLYHHHKVRSCDCMLKGTLLYCIDNGIPLCGRKIESAADFLYLTDVGLLGEAERNQDKNVVEMVSNIVNRRLFKRATVISMNSFVRPGVDGEEAEKQKSTLVHSLALASLQEHRAIAIEIWEAAGKPGRKEEVWLDFPKEPKLNDLARTFVNVGRPDAPDFRTLGDFVPLEQWGKQYVLQKWRGHVFCKPEYVEKISRSAIDVLSGKYGIQFNKYARTLCNLDP
jgi:HD superfamily phosphohydrolase